MLKYFIGIFSPVLEFTVLLFLLLLLLVSDMEFLGSPSVFYCHIAIASRSSSYPSYNRRLSPPLPPPITATYSPPCPSLSILLSPPLPLPFVITFFLLLYCSFTTFLFTPSLTPPPPRLSPPPCRQILHISRERIR